MERKAEKEEKKRKEMTLFKTIVFGSTGAGEFILNDRKKEEDFKTHFVLSAFFFSQNERKIFTRYSVCFKSFRPRVRPKHGGYPSKTAPC